MVVGNLNFLIKRRGRSAELITNYKSEYNPETGKNEEITDSYPVKAYFAEYNLGEESNSEVATGKRWVAIGTLDTFGNTLPTPNTKDKIVGAEDTVVVVKVQTIYNGETAVCYLCTVGE